MAFVDPVDPSTESSLWPGRVGLFIVAHGGLRWLDCSSTSSAESGSLGRSCLVTRLGLRGRGGEAWPPDELYATV
jgi:hypothetical protein